MSRVNHRQIEAGRPRIPREVHEQSGDGQIQGQKGVARALAQETRAITPGRPPSRQRDETPVTRSRGIRNGSARPTPVGAGTRPCGPHRTVRCRTVSGTAQRRGHAEPRKVRWRFRLTLILIPKLTPERLWLLRQNLKNRNGLYQDTAGGPLGAVSNKGGKPSASAAAESARKGVCLIRADRHGAQGAPGRALLQRPLKIGFQAYSSCAMG